MDDATVGASRIREDYPRVPEV
eukprot:SAG31_NODE_42909_length_269_cov_0.917647_1_plen_21_part_01